MSTDRPQLSGDEFVTDREVAAFVKTDLSWIPSALDEYRSVIRGKPSVEGLGQQECAAQALSLLDQLGHPHPRSIQNQSLIAMLALMYTHAGLVREPHHKELRKALYLLRPVATLKSGRKADDWSLGVSAIMLASFHGRAFPRGMGETELMEYLVAMTWPPDKKLPGGTTFTTARGIAKACRKYPTTREQFNREWKFLQQWFQKHKTWTDLYYRTGQVYDGMHLRQLDEPSSAEPIVAVVKPLLFWAAVVAGCVFLWPYARIVVLIVIGLSTLFWCARIYYLARG